MQFEFLAPSRIIFGTGALSKVAEIAPAIGRHALVVCGSGSVSMDVLQQCLDESGIDVEIFRVKNEPDIPKI